MLTYKEPCMKFLLLKRAGIYVIWKGKTLGNYAGWLLKIDTKELKEKEGIKH